MKNPIINKSFSPSLIAIATLLAIFMHSASAAQSIFVEANATEGDGSAKAPYGSIQEAVDAAATEPGPDTIMIAAGEYVENIDIEDGDPVTLKGQGDVTIKPEDETEDVIKAEGDVHFQNLSIDGGDGLGDRGIDAKDGSFVFKNISVVGTDGDSIRVRDFDELTIVNVGVSSLGADGFDIEDGSSVSIKSSSASDCDDEGLEVDRVDTIEVVGGEYSGNGDDGINLDSCTDIRIVNVSSSNNDGNGYQTEAESRDVESVEIIGSEFVNNEEHGIHLEDDGAFIFSVSLRGNRCNGNDEFGYDLVTLAEIVARGIRPVVMVITHFPNVFAKHS